MPTPPLSDEVLRETIRIVAAAEGKMARAAKMSGIHRNTLIDRMDEAVKRGLATDRHFTLTAPPSELPTASDLLKRRSADFSRKQAAHEAARLIPVTVPLEGPIGIAHFGDPHVDDDGTNIGLLQEHVALVKKTPGLFAGNVGDITNNWVGRLARLYGEQSTSAAEAWVLADWLMTAMPWLYVVQGNHDAWSGTGDPLKWIAAQAGVLYQANGVRLNITFPNGKAVRVNARHDFQGHSQWNTAHGPAKAAQMGWRDHVLTCGHKHTSGYQVLKDPSTGLITHAIRVASYKTLDRYAQEKGLPDQHIFCCPVTIIRPRFGDDSPNLVTTIFDPGTAAEFLTWLRKRRTE